jgi:hypothetical protein
MVHISYCPVFKGLFIYYAMGEGVSYLITQHLGRGRVQNMKITNIWEGFHLFGVKILKKQRVREGPGNFGF